MTDLSQLTHALLDAAKAAGATQADAIAVDGRAVSIDVREGRLEQAERAEGVEIGLRVLIDGHQACVSASDISPPRTMFEMAQRAVAMARETPPADPYLGLAEPAQLAQTWDLSALELSDSAPEPSAEALEHDARTAESAALAVSGVNQVQSASASYSSRRLHIAATNGFEGGYGAHLRATSAVAIAGEGLGGMERDWAAESRTFQSDLPDAASIGLLAGQRAVERSGAQQPPPPARSLCFMTSGSRAA